MRVALLALCLVAPPWLAARLAGAAPELAAFAPPAPPPAPWPAFDWTFAAAMLALLAALLGPPVARILEARPWVPPAPPRARFPGWGWAGAALVGVAWLLAWTRFEWFAPWQRYTFTPLWVGYIIVVNALAARRSGYCMLRDAPGYFLALFPLSALCWWFFEYLNRFTRNWYYVGLGELAPWEYVIGSSIAFATVLPAVLGTQQWLGSLPRFAAGLERFRRLPLPAGRRWGPAALVLGIAALAGLVLWPERLFPLVWVAPWLVIAGLQAIAGDERLLSPLGRGDWRALWLAALSALVCGFFWELWNARSLAHWEYAIPYAQRFEVFAMPLLGYAGYLPFGLTCVALVHYVLGAPPNAGTAASPRRPPP